MIADSFPAPVYAETVLGPNFEDAQKRYFLDALIEIHYAHTRMLACRGILTDGEDEDPAGGLQRPRSPARSLAPTMTAPARTCSSSSKNC